MAQQSPGAPQITDNDPNRGANEAGGGTFETGSGTYEAPPAAGTTTGARTGQGRDTALNQQAAANGRMAETGRTPGSLLQDPQGLLQRWESVQVGFVDNPREAVGDAEQLVSSAIDQIEQLFRRQRETLESSWSEGRDPSTDDLRAAFQSYRDFFGRLLQV